MQSLILEIRLWMTNNKLMINDFKTEFLLIGTREQIAKARKQTIKVSDVDIEPSANVKHITNYFMTSVNIS